jgi:Tol biopolymer transport system component
LVAGDTNAVEDAFLRDRQTGETVRVSVNTAGQQGNSNSFFPMPSADGRFVAFESQASNLVAGDTNNNPDVFVRDRQTGQTTRVSVASDATQSNGYSSVDAISADGRYVVFMSAASNLVAGDTNNAEDVFVRDRQTGTTTRISVDSAGVQGNASSNGASLSADGRIVLFQSDANNLVADDRNGATDIFTRNVQTGRTQRVTLSNDGRESNGASGRPTMTPDGAAISFSSNANNLVAGDTNNQGDVFVRELGSAAPSAAAWAVAVSYAVGDTVTFDGVSYRCRQAHRSQSDWTPSAVPALWERVALGSGCPWATSTAYAVGDVVTFDGVTYRCLQAHSSAPGWEPPLTPALWQRL